MTDNYKVAPTWLYNLKNESKLFTTQKEVNAAWKSGWYGPPGGVEDSPPVSEGVFPTKAKMVNAAVDDPRYQGIKLSAGWNAEAIVKKIVEFEIKHGIVIEPEGDED